MPEILGEFLDRLVNIKMTESPEKQHPDRIRGAQLKIAEFARKKQGASFTYLAAKKLSEQIDKGDFVFIITGAGAPPFMWAGETDGPLGAAALARAIDVAYKAKPVVITDKNKMDALIAVCNAAELAVQPEETVRKRAYGAAIAETFPLDEDEAKEATPLLIEKYCPAAMITVEMTGPNAKGIMHSMTATDRTPYVAKAYHLIDEAKRKKIVTIGIGDGGNEIGFGKIRNEVKSLGGIYADCSPCPCRDGVVTINETDVLVPAAVSNWGAYGVESCLAAIVGDNDIMHNENVERRMLEAGVNHGLACGFGRQMLDVDGTSLETNQALITIMREMDKNYLRKFEQRSF